MYGGTNRWAYSRDYSTLFVACSIEEWELVTENWVGPGDKAKQCDLASFPGLPIFGLQFVLSI